LVKEENLNRSKQFKIPYKLDVSMRSLGHGGDPFNLDKPENRPKPTERD